MWWENKERNFPGYRKVREGLAGNILGFQKINKDLPCWKPTNCLAVPPVWAKAVTGRMWMRHSWYFSINCHFDHAAERKKNGFQAEGGWWSCLETSPMMGWRENDSQDLPSTRCVTASLPQVQKLLQDVYHSAFLLCHPVLDGLWVWDRLCSPSSHGKVVKSAVLLQISRGWGPCWCLLAMQRQKHLLGSAGPGAVCCCNTGLEEDSNLRGQEGASCCTDTYMEIIW